MCFLKLYDAILNSIRMLFQYYSSNTWQTNVAQCIAGNECIMEEQCDQQVNKNFYAMLSPNLHNLEKITFCGEDDRKRSSFYSLQEKTVTAPLLQYK